MATITAAILNKRLVRSNEGRLAFTDVVIPVGQKSMELRIDRSSLTGASTGNLIEFEVSISLDNGLTWGGEYLETVNGETTSYPLWHSATAADGELLHPRTGVVVQFSSFTFQLPQPLNVNRKARCNIRMIKNGTIGCSAVLK
jgi:hypothetical protein